jgi:hypothetical protein
MSLRRPLLDFAALGLAAFGAFLALVSTPLPWLSLFGNDLSYWELSKAQDIMLVPAVFAVVGVAIAAFLWPRIGVLTLAAVAVSAGLVDFVFPQAAELVNDETRGFDGSQAGEFVAGLGAGMLVGSIVIRLVDIPAPDEPGLPLLALIGLLVIGLVGFLQPFAELLPVEQSSVWEIFTAADVLRALIGLATAGMALAAILVPRQVGLIAAVVALGSYTATDNVVSSIEALAAEADGAEPFVSLLFLAPLGTAGIVLVAFGARAAFRRA